MKMCQSHWKALRTAIEGRGLGHLIAANGRDAMARTAAELEGKAELADFDPLMAAHNMIWDRSLHVIGLGIMFGEQCPVCEMLKVLPPPPVGCQYVTNDEFFIDGPADAVLEMCKEHGIDKPEAPDAHP